MRILIQKPWPLVLINSPYYTPPLGSEDEVQVSRPRISIALLAMGGFAGELFSFWLANGELKAIVEPARTVEEVFSLSCEIRLIPQVSTGFPMPEQLIAAFEAAGKPSTVVLVSQTYVRSVPLLVERNIQGLLSYTTPLSVLAHAIQLVQAGGRFVSQDLLNAQWSSVREMQQKPPDYLRGKLPLTAREREVLSLVRLGYSNKRIATKLGITEATVKLHVRQLMKKLNAENRTQAAIIAGLIEST